MNVNLTKTELIDLKELSKGYTHKEIAKHRGVSYRTVKSHLENAMLKLNARNGVNLVAIAKDLGLIMLLVAVLCSAFSDFEIEQRRFRLVRSFGVRGGRVEVLNV